jgi:membrane protein implicated in regulation of membrane protease activity
MAEWCYIKRMSWSLSRQIGIGTAVVAGLVVVAVLLSLGLTGFTANFPVAAAWVGWVFKYVSFGVILAITAFLLGTVLHRVIRDASREAKIYCMRMKEREKELDTN